MKRIISIGPWLMELFNPPPRASLNLSQKMWRVALVTVTMVTVCVIVALGLSLGFFAVQRSREFLEGAPQVRNGITILIASILMNIACVFTLLQIKKLDGKLMPKGPEQSEGPPDPGRPASP